MGGAGKRAWARRRARERFRAIDWATGPSAEWARACGLITEGMCHLSPVLDGFGEVVGSDWATAGKVGDSAGDLKDVIDGESGEAELGEGSVEESLAGRI